MGDTPVATGPPDGGGGGGGGGGGDCAPELLKDDFPGIGGGALKFLGNVWWLDTAGNGLLNAGGAGGAPLFLTGGGGTDALGGGGGGVEGAEQQRQSQQTHAIHAHVTLYLHDVDSPLPVDTAAPRVFRSVGIPFANSPPN